MEKYCNQLAVVAGAVGGWLAWVLGGWDVLPMTLVSMMVLDYLTGVIKAIVLKSLSSEIGYKGILKKVLILVVVAVSVLLQKLLGGAIPLREIVIMFFIANEGLSLLENASALLPIPQRLTNVLLQIREKAEKPSDEEAASDGD